MSASSGQTERFLQAALLCVLFGYSGGALAADEEEPDLEFLEYLGSWDDTDEDWELLAEVDTEGSEAESEQAGRRPQQDKIAELENEN